ncbi:MAG: LysM peptidoglycan-binding domain-containing protein [Cocleimonas sp.]|nr:LysM peptidoglycan-binding domain-containing protein [Cocleimonas sp.]
MDRKIKLLAASSLVVAMASACTPYNARTGTYDNNGYGAGASQNSQGTSQNSQGASQNAQVNNNTKQTNNTPAKTCAPCRSNTTYSTNTANGKYNQQWYIDRWNKGQNKQSYTPPPVKRYTPAPRQTTDQAGGHNQQWYIDRWNRQQQTQHSKPRYTPPKKTYTGYGGAKPTPPKQTYTPKPYTPPPAKPYTPPAKPYTPPKKPAANYYDYSKAGGYSTSNKKVYSGASNSASNKSLYTGASRSANNTASNKSIYTGSYSNNTYKPYAPKTYTGGANSNVYSSSSSSSSSSNNSYSDSHGGGEIASGAYKAGDSNYSVKKGDTVFSVMRLTGVYWKDIIKKNSLTAPYTISPGQTLRLK